MMDDDTPGTEAEVTDNHPRLQTPTGFTRRPVMTSSGGRTHARGVDGD